MKTQSTDEIRRIPNTGVVIAPARYELVEPVLRPMAPDQLAIWRLVDMAPKLLETLEDLHRLTAGVRDSYVQESRRKAQQLIDTMKKG